MMTASGFFLGEGGGVWFNSLSLFIFGGCWKSCVTQLVPAEVNIDSIHNLKAS
jgi:hypothetical protein